MKDKKKIIVIVIVIFIAIILFLLYYNKKNEVTFVLLGDDIITVEYNEEYKDPGYKALNGFNSDISKYVTTNREIDTNKIGEYIIEYTLNYSKNNLKLTRTVNVVNTKIENFDIILNGDETIYLPLNSTYTEQNGYVVDNTTNKKINNALKITNNIDTNKIGEYKVTYEFKFNNKKKEITRKVIVYNIQANYVLNNDKVNVKLLIEGLNNYQYAMIDNKKLTSKTIDYEAKKDSNNKITIYLDNGKQIEKEINTKLFNNYTCSGTITRNGTTLTVNSNSNINKYEWDINGKNEIGNSTYNIFKSITNGNVKLTTNNNDTYQIPCNISDQLVYHFVYDADNTKPYMNCNTYTSEDRITLDNKLKKAIEDAGYGTRAGVVEAARFMVGAMTHKIRYLGPKKDIPELGRYFYKGLNIGKSGAWGCTVSGWVQGLDCTNFVEWAFYQNGIRTNSFKNERSEIINVIDKVKVGDLVYTPENVSKDKCRNTTCLDHVGIIIGIDDNYIYVAEQTAWGTRVNKKDKHNLPKNGEEFSLVHFYNYSSDGNLTSMWMD